MTDKQIQNNDWTSPEIPLDKPSAARIYDYMLGGYHNFEIDRQVAKRLQETNPDVVSTAVVNRTFLRRAATYVAQQGIQQYIDLGSGIPTAGNLHEIIREIIPNAPVVYVDIDPVAVAHSQIILKGDPNTKAFLADVSDTGRVLNHPDLRSLIDFSRPVGLFAVAIAHYITDLDRARAMMAAYCDILVPGSYLAMAVWTFDGAPQEMLERYLNITSGLSTSLSPRTREQVLDYFNGFELIEPGLVYGPLWRPDGPDDPLYHNPEMSLNWVGVGRKV